MLSLVLCCQPYPIHHHYLHPNWIFLLIIYIQLFHPSSLNLYFIILNGIILDTLFTSILGTHMLALVFVSWIACIKQKRFIFYPVVQQWLFILMLAIIYLTTLLLINRLINMSYLSSKMYITMLVDSLLWIVVEPLLSHYLKPHQYLKSNWN